MRIHSPMRRSMLAGAALLPWASLAGPARAGGVSGPAFVSARQADGGGYEVALLDARGTVLARVPMPERGHSFAFHAGSQRIVAFGRQPGFFARVFSTATPERFSDIPAAPGRHFFGHGVFLPDGDMMVATENEYEHGRGVLGVYRTPADGPVHRVAEWSTHGIGPHQVLLLADGRTLCVANGGILTHPDYGKQALNLPDMRPSLVYLDARDGSLLEQHFLAPDLHQLSIRHLTQAGDGSVWFGCQYQGSRADDVPLVGRHERGQALEMLHGPENLRRDMRQYVGSMACSADGAVVASSSPAGGCVLLWSVQDARVLGRVVAPDGCGVASIQAGRFVVTTGLGDVLQMPATGAPGPRVLQHEPGVAWDNHLFALQA